MVDQILNVLNMGIVILDPQYMVLEWNQWMEIHSGIKRNDILGTSLFNHYPHLSTSSFTRSCKSVIKFGNYVYFSQKLHNYLFPFKATGIYSNTFDFMQQSCNLTPLRDEQGTPSSIVITVQNVTESVYLERSLKTMTQKDSLTGIYNRRYLDKRLDEEFKRFKRSKRDFSFLMIDIDNFKSVNDTYGHQFGDQVLKEIAGTCSSIVRGSDIVARFGGEEFAVTLVDSQKAGALSFAERLRIQIENNYVSHEDGTKVSVTVSIGLSTSEDNPESIEQIVGRADAALYLSKHNGKNCVSVFDPELHDEDIRNS